MRKLKLDKKGLSPLVAVIVLLTLVMVLGAIIAGTLSGAPRPVLPATTAVNLATEYGGNPAAGDYVLVMRHEYGSVISDAIVLDNQAEFPILMNMFANLPLNAESTHWNNMVLKINGEKVPVALVYLTSNGEVIVNCLTPDFDLILDSTQWVWPAEADAAGAMDFAKGDMMVVMLYNPEYPVLPPPLEPSIPLESSDLIQLVWEPRDLMLVEYLVQ